MARSKIAALRVPRRSEHEAEVDQGHPDGSVVVPSVRTAKAGGVEILLEFVGFMF